MLTKIKNQERFSHFARGIFKAGRDFQAIFEPASGDLRARIHTAGAVKMRLAVPRGYRDGYRET